MRRLLIFIIVMLIMLSGCVTEKKEAVETPKPDIQSPQAPVEKPERPDPAAIKANEAGQVMILMYHVIGAEKEAAWRQTEENFRRDLVTLYKEGYSLVDLNDFVENNIQAPAGRTPVVLTFDDGSEGHFRYLIEEDGSEKIDPMCVVGIILEFAGKYPEFGSAATFYVNDRPFGQKDYWEKKLQELVRLGFSIGNHTLTHPKLNKLSAEQVQKELAGLAGLIEDVVPDYKVKSLALPHGLSPLEQKLAGEGSYDGYEYKHNAVLKVGAQPAVSPVHKEFQPLRLPRVQASSEELEKWLTYFKKYPEKRYISDGDASTVAIPREMEDIIDKGRLGNKELILYP